MELYILLLAIILLAPYNGYMIKWGLQPKKDGKLQDLWHGIGFIIRLLLSVVIYLFYGQFLFWLSVIINWHLYDIIINLTRGDKWYHTGDNFFDRSPYCWIAKGIILLIGLLFLI